MPQSNELLRLSDYYVNHSLTGGKSRRRRSSRFALDKVSSFVISRIEK